MQLRPVQAPQVRLNACKFHAMGIMNSLSVCDLLPHLVLHVLVPACKMLCKDYSRALAGSKAPFDPTAAMPCGCCHAGRSLQTFFLRSLFPAASKQCMAFCSGNRVWAWARLLWGCLQAQCPILAQVLRGVPGPQQAKLQGIAVIPLLYLAPLLQATTMAAATSPVLSVWTCHPDQPLPHSWDAWHPILHVQVLAVLAEMTVRWSKATSVGGVEAGLISSPGQVLLERFRSGVVLSCGAQSVSRSSEAV